MRRLESLLLRRRIAAATSVGVCLSVSLIAWLGYVAVREWQHSAVALAAREAEEASDLVVSALTRDMTAVQRSVLSSPALDRFTLRPPFEAINIVASAFARYQYPESFFLWRRDSVTQSAWFWHRRERLPVWAHPPDDPNLFPVAVETDASVGPVLLERIRADVAQARRFSVFETELDGVPYQVVARLFYSDAFYQEVDAILGFTVNLDWVREHYFSFLLRDAVWVLGARADVLLEVTDDRGQAVSSTGSSSAAASVPSNQRTFPLMFFNPQLVAANPPADFPRRNPWVVQAVMRDDSSLVAALAAGRRMLTLQVIAAGTLALGLLLIVRASRARQKLTDLQSEFVSSVTHEFKTPIATIKAAGESLASGRIDSSAEQQAYAGFIVHESRRLTRLVDNLLTFSRVAETGAVQPQLEPVGLTELVAAAVRRFPLHLTHGKFDVDVELPPSLPLIRGDANAIGLMLDNLIDNVIRHSKTEHRFAIRVFERADRVVVEVVDSGGGIPEHELEQVTRKFYRGGNAGHGGTGLGLAIANRIVAEHAGTLTIHSNPGVGTTVTVSFPALSQHERPVPSSVAWPIG